MERIINEIKEYVKSLDTPDNVVYKENELLIKSCFSKAMEIVEGHRLIEIDEAPRLVYSTLLNKLMTFARENVGNKINEVPEGKKILDSIYFIEECYPFLKDKTK